MAVCGDVSEETSHEEKSWLGWPLRSLSIPRCSGLGFHEKGEHLSLCLLLL